MFLLKRLIHPLQHGSMLFMPDLDPLLPLVLGQLVLVQDSAGETSVGPSVSCFLLLPHRFFSLPPPWCERLCNSLLCPAESLTLASESKQSLSKLSRLRLSFGFIGTIKKLLNEFRPKKSAAAAAVCWRSWSEGGKSFVGWNSCPQNPSVSCDNFPREMYHSPLGKKPLGGQVTALVHRRVELAKLGLDGIGGQEHSGLRGAVDLLWQDRLLHLQEEELAGNVLDQLLGHVLWVELDSQLELQRNLLLHVLRDHLGGGKGAVQEKRQKRN